MAENVLSGYQPYSVLLLRPEYIGEGPESTYYTFVKALSPKGAVRRAREEACLCDDVHGRAEDYTPLLVLPGHVQGLDPEAVA